jgi:ATP/ADP translocase
MKRIVYHLILPALMPVLFFVVASTPVEVLGCLVRGLIALLIALISGLAALGAAIIGTKVGSKGGTRHDKNSIWWLMSTLILVIPVIAMILLA